MAGLNLYAGGFGGVASSTAPQYGSAKSYSSGGGGVSSAAFAGPSTNVTPTLGQTISPAHGFGLAVWLGIGSIAGLIWLRSTLPN